MVIALTNHALDHIVRDVYEAGITKNIVRIGSRSKDEVISEFSLDSLERTQPKGALNRRIGEAFRMMDGLPEVSGIFRHDTASC